MLDRPGASGAFVLYFLQSSRAVGLHLKEEWATMVPSIICTWDGLNSHPSQCGVDLSLSLLATVATLTPTKHLLYVQPSVSLISNFFDQFFEYPRRSASLLSSAVIRCFYTLDMNLTQLLLLSLWKVCNKKFFPCLFVRRRRKNYNNMTIFFFSFLWLLFISMLWHF